MGNIKVVPVEHQGNFREKSVGLWHQFVPTKNEWAIKHGFLHELVNSNHSPVRVCSTRAYVVVDEDADGNPVIEKWMVERVHSFEVVL